MILPAVMGKKDFTVTMLRHYNQNGRIEIEDYTLVKL